ncbi:MAG: hypothetical protein ACD_29C00043G0003 [uncultured bacterium]|nr:MAG: hypothetical protein ACD_29C00043G0003 [uncultured bacterium]
MNDRSTLPVFYFNPCIFFIDDDLTLLQALELRFSKSYSCAIFDTPELFLNFFENYHSPLSKIKFLQSNTASEDYDLRYSLPINFDISKISNLEKNKNRFSEAAVLIIDHHMPQISGLEICNKLKNYPIKKILLTGLANNSEVINAFNAGAIDRYIDKGQPDLFAKLNCHIAELSYDYFYDLSKPMLKNLESDKIIVLQDPVFIAYFNQYCEQNDITEFYLINKIGHFLLIDNQGQKSYFVLMSKNNIDYFVEHNQTAGDNIKTTLLKKMLDGELIPFFPDEKECWEIESVDLRSYFYPAKKLQGRDTYFYAVIKKPRLQLVK